MGKRGRLRNKQRREGERRFEHSRQGWGIEDGRIVVAVRRGWCERLGIIRGNLVQVEEASESGDCGD